MREAISLSRLLERSESALDNARLVIAGLDEPRLCWTPAPGIWSVAHCLDHLATSAATYRPALDGAMLRAHRADGTEATVRPGIIGGWLIRTVGPEGTRRLKAPGAFRPAPEPPPQVGERFEREQQSFIERLRRCAGLDLNSAKVISPASPLLRLTLGEALALLVGHTERHLAQAWRVRHNPRFPGPSAG